MSRHDKSDTKEVLKLTGIVLYDVADNGMLDKPVHLCAFMLIISQRTVVGDLISLSYRLHD